MLIKILIAVAVIVLLLIVIVALQPSQFRIVRSMKVAAPAAAVFAQVNDFHKWMAWSPWEKRDPAMKRTYEGPPAGSGAVYRWAGNKEVGEGGMTITESRPDELIRIRLEFLKPFACTNTAEFTFEPLGEQTNVTWSMTGTNNFVAKAFHLIVNMDKMIGADFEKGLAAMKSAAEAQVVETAATTTN